ncbi:uncharacterized protein TNCV_1778691 [Trichonephila clavipes]|nr:uncharacterized protein TNCV_1778691 [Trichonephila clavipes]
MSLVYANKPQTLDYLEDHIRRVIADIRPQMLERVIENWTSRLDYIRASRGSRMPEIIFKIQGATLLRSLLRRDVSCERLRWDNIGMFIVVNRGTREEYVMPTKATCEAETFLFGRSRDYYSVVGPSHPSRGGQRVAWEMHRSLLFRLNKGRNGYFNGDRSNFYGIAAQGLLATDHVILNHGQVTWTTPELSPPLLTTTLHQREDVPALDRFNVHRCPTRRVFSGTRLELVTRQATFRYLYHSATGATRTLWDRTI